MSTDDQDQPDTTGPTDAGPTEQPGTAHAQETGGGAGSDSALTPTAGERDSGPDLVGERRGMFGSSLGNDTSGYGGLRQPILFPGASKRPYGGAFDEIADALQEAAGAAYADLVSKVVIDRGEMTMHVPRRQLPAVAQLLRDEPALRFEICTGVCAVNYPDDVGAELHAAYHFLSITHGSRRVRVEVTCPDIDPHIPSIVGTYPANDWHEREAYDMFGIVFDGHPGLTRILMPDDWPGHPQRKDYPLGGIPVEYKGAEFPAPDQRRSYN